MASLAESLVQQLNSPGVISKVSNQIGVDESTTSQAVSAAIPLLMTALARNASKPKGAASLNEALEKDHDGSVLDDLPGYLDHPDTDDGDGILRHTLRRPARRGAEQSGRFDRARRRYGGQAANYGCPDRARYARQAETPGRSG